MALAALEAHFEDLLSETVIEICHQSGEDERLSDFFRTSLEEDLKTFHTPSTDRVRPMFSKYLGHDVMEGWSWNPCDPAKARRELNLIAKKRGDIAHRYWRPLPGQTTQHAVIRDAMRKHVHSSRNSQRRRTRTCRKIQTSRFRPSEHERVRNLCRDLQRRPSSVFGQERSSTIDLL